MFFTSLNLAELLVYLVSVLLFVAFCVKLISVAYGWIIGPLVQAARTAKSPSRFLLSDLAWLVLQLQFAMGVMSGAFPADMEAGVRITALVLWCLAATLLWAAGLHLVSQAGIVHPLRRGIVFMVLLPGLPVVVFGAPLPVIQLLSRVGGPDSWSPLRPTLITIGSEALGLVLLAVALRWLARWTVTSGTLPQGPQRCRWRRAS